MTTWNTLADGAFSSRLALTLVHSLWQVGLLAAGLWLFERLWKRHSLEAVYAGYVAALVLSLVAVPITFTLVGDPPSGEPQPAETAIVPSDDRIDSADVSQRGRAPAAQVAHARPAAAPPVQQSDASPWTAMSAIDGLRQAWGGLAPWISGLYACGVLLMLARIVRGVWYAQRLRAQASIVHDGRLAEVLGSLARGWRLRVVPALAEVEGIAVPKVIGLVRPTILLPLAATSGVPAGELEMILAHELAHVRRYDLWVNLLQRVAEAVLFFNPALWFLSRRISSLREFCCDELTCRTLADRHAQPRVRYAEALVHVAELAYRGKAARGEKLSEVAALAVSGRSPSQLRRRVARLVGEPVREPLQLSRSGMLALVAIVLLFLVAGFGFSHGPDPSTDAAEDKQPAASQPGGKRLADGTRVEVVGIGTHRESPKKWWNSDAAPLASVPFRVERSAVPVLANDVAREVVCRVHPLPPGAHVLREVEPFVSTTGGEVVDQQGSELDGYFSRVFSLPRATKFFRLRVGVAAGKWETLAKAGRDGGEAIGFNGAAIGFNGAPGVIFSSAFGKDDGTVVVVSHSVQDRDTRVVAIDVAGTTHTPRLTNHYVAGAAKQSEYSFHKLSPAAVDHFEFQTREYEWVSFDKLPVYPRDDKAAEPEEEASAPEAAEAAQLALQDAPPPKGEPELVIRGRVQDGQGRGIAGADVGLMVVHDVNAYDENNPFAAVVKTDEQGLFRLPVYRGLKKEWGTIWARAQGFGPQRLRYTGSLRQFTKKATVFTLEAAEATAIRLLDPDKNPVPGARVQAVQVRVPHGVGYTMPIDWQDDYVATSDAAGVARIPSFAPVALDHLRVESEPGGRVEYDQNYFLNAKPQEDGPHFEVAVPAAGRVAGHVTTDAADAPQGVPVELRTAAEPAFGPRVGVWGVAQTVPDDSAEFAATIAAGRLIAKLDLPPAGPWRAQVPTNLVVPQGKTAELSIALERGVHVKGLIRKQDNLAGYPDFSLAVIYGPSAVLHETMDHKVEVKTDEQGRFEAFVPPGPIELRLHSAPRDYHHVEWWDGRSRGGIWGSRREVPEGVAEFELAPIDLVPTELVEGKLVDRDGNPLGDWTVFGFPKAGVMNSFSGVETEADGTFSGYVPRTYPVQTWTVTHVNDKKDYRPQSTKYRAKVISENPLVLEVGEEVKNWPIDE